MEIVTSCMKEGIAIGREEGRHTSFARGYKEGYARGIQEGEARIIIIQLTHRFSELTEQMEARVRSLPVASLEALGKAIFDFTSEADVVARLDQFSQSN